ncbi:MAG: replication factor C large subunit [Methanobrevibacter sp.]|uniref:replication factor C large subunit n=1 Tax=Methanobrevibacter sp. TaxID=66852 RepID=UPI0026E0945E|nr:replication factor C large subunit [Methanobrevibacter sp.]MDO5847968.1 replication factor C large subunit [Methanobrevibacter sp.]
MLWTKKYSPKTIEDVVGHNKEKETIQNWINLWKEGKPQKPLLLVGPAGIGKTTLAHLIGDQFGECVELNASDKRSQDIILSTVGESSATRSFFSNDHKVIILDEVDGIHGTNDRGGVAAIGKIIKNSKHPLILIANDFYSKRLTNIKTKCQVIKMKKIRSPSINKLLKEIAAKEGIKANPAALNEIAKRSQGDMRSALNTFQALANEEEVLELEDVEKMSKKDERSTIFDAVGITLNSQTPSKVKNALRVEEDPTLVMEYIAENVPRRYKKKEDLKRAYENLAKADLYFGRAQRSRNYGYWKYASDFMGVGVSNSKEKKYGGFSKIMTPTIFTKMGRARGKRNLRDVIADKMSKKMHISNAVAISMFPYLEIMFSNDELAWEISDFLGLDEDEIKRFRKKKIPKKVITKMEKLKGQLHDEERKRRNEELANKIIEEAGEIAEKEVEISESVEETADELFDEEFVEEIPEEEEIDEVEEEKVEEKPKKKKDVQTSLFSF